MTHRALMALSLGALLAGCNGQAPSGETAAPSAAPTRQACTRLTDAQAATVLALPQARAQPDKPEACSWNSGKDEQPFPVLNLSVVAMPDDTSAAKLFVATSGTQSQVSQDVNASLGEKSRRSGRAPQGLGDEAWLQADEMAGVDTALLVVRRGSTVYTLGVVGMGSAQGVGERLEAAARAVLAAP